MSGRELKKKRRSSYSSDEDGDRDKAYSTYISEEKYRTMLGEHISKYKRRLGNSSTSPAATRNGVPAMRSGGGSRDQKLTNDHRGGALRLGSASEFFKNSTQSLGNHIQSDFSGRYGGDRFASLLSLKSFQMNVETFTMSFGFLTLQKGKVCHLTFGRFTDLFMNLLSWILGKTSRTRSPHPMKS